MFFERAFQGSNFEQVEVFPSYLLERGERVFYSQFESVKQDLNRVTQRTKITADRDCSHEIKRR